MAKYTDPTQNELNSAEASISDILVTAYPTLLTKVGSAIRELVIRPMAFIYSWLTANLRQDQEQTSIEYLQQSQLTENPTADSIASNYFVERKQGTRSRGELTLIVRTSMIQLAVGTRFTVADCVLQTEKRIIAMDSTYNELDDVLYVPITPYDTSAGTYMLGIPVAAVEVGDIEVSAGADVTVEDTTSGLIVAAYLTSAITGGSYTETDAELMERARYNTAESGIGSYYGIKKKLDHAPVVVSGMSIVAGEDAPLFRARFNSTNINPGGFVDCYVRTQTQPAVTTLVKTLTYDVPSTTHTLVINDQQCAGNYYISQVRAGTAVVNNYAVSYGSSDPLMGAQGARLGVAQTTTISFTTSAAVSSLEVTVTLAYMPGIQSLQTYINSDANHFIGQNLMIKAAVPVTLRMTCVAHADYLLSDDTLTAIKTAISAYVNDLPVGIGYLNFSDICKTLKRTYTDIELRLPCVLTADVMLLDGSRDSFYTTTGILDLRNTVGSNHAPSTMCFFSLIPDNIRIETV